MIPGFSADDLRVLQLFYPYSYQRTMAALQGQARFVHYSSAEAAMKILESGEVWMRKASAMNDFREIEYGRDRLLEAYQSEKGLALRSFLNGLFPEITEALENLFNGWYPHFEFDTYLSCISEHDPSEDGLGRLSMWRAYGGAAGIAIVMKGAPFLMPSDALRAYTSPVAYLSHAQFQREFDQWVDGLVSEAELLQTRGREAVLNNIFGAFRFAAICTKHPGFHEEREWRIVYSPTFAESKRIKPHVTCIGGVPQVVQKIPLEDIPEEGLVGITPPDLIERVIIGPAEFPREIRQAVIELLKRKNVADAEQKVIVSDIPLRT